MTAEQYRDSSDALRAACRKYELVRQSFRRREVGAPELAEARKVLDQASLAYDDALDQFIKTEAAKN